MKKWKRSLTKQLRLQVVVMDIAMPFLNGVKVKAAFNPPSDAPMVCAVCRESRVHQTPIRVNTP
jgi:hypothetical protein